jgi:hypothetical protein
MLKNIRLPKGRLNGKADYPKIEDSFSLRDYVKQGVEEFAVPSTPYTLPVADATTLGGVKEGLGVSIDANGVISASNTYTLPVATSNVLGGVKMGKGVLIDGNNKINADFDSAFVLIFDPYNYNVSTYSVYANYNIANNAQGYLQNAVSFNSVEHIKMNSTTTKSIKFQVSANNVSFNDVITIPVGQDFISIETVDTFNITSFYHNLFVKIQYTTGTQIASTQVYTNTEIIYPRLLVVGGSETFSTLQAQTFFQKI